MKDVPDKEVCNNRVNKYEDEIMVNKELKYKKFLEAADEIFCGPIMVNGEKMSCFACVVG